MGLDSYLPLKKSGQSVIDQNLPYRFLRGQPLKRAVIVYKIRTILKSRCHTTAPNWLKISMQGWFWVLNKNEYF